MLKKNEEEDEEGPSRVSPLTDSPGVACRHVGYGKSLQIVGLMQVVSPSWFGKIVWCVMVYVIILAS